jgi:hypothetical protein
VFDDSLQREQEIGELGGVGTLGTVIEPALKLPQQRAGIRVAPECIEQGGGGQLAELSMFTPEGNNEQLEPRFVGRGQLLTPDHGFQLFANLLQTIAAGVFDRGGWRRLRAEPEEGDKAGKPEEAEKSHECAIAANPATADGAERVGNKAIGSQR